MRISVPRASGDEPRARKKGGAGTSVFPARAGMSPIPQDHLALWSRVPRASGDEPSPSCSTVSS